MNLTGFKWDTHGFDREVIEYAGDFYWVQDKDGERFAYLTDEIIERIQKEILNQIDELNYFYVHQDQERLIETVQTLYVLRGYLTDENPS